MKKILLLLLVISALSCRTKKQEPLTAQSWMDQQNFTLEKPEGWETMNIHGEINFSPPSKKSFQNHVAITQIQIEDAIDFHTYVLQKIAIEKRNFDIFSHNASFESSDLGDIYIYEYEYSWKHVHNTKENPTAKKNIYKKYFVFFQHHQEYYEFRYLSVKELFYKYFPDAIGILSSIEFKTES